MQKLVSGIHQFQKKIFGEKRSLFERLAEGQRPRALFITCADSRIDPNLLTQTDPGELFILRNAGNIVPPIDAGCSGEAATIEYAVRVLKVHNIVICGHSHCGAMGALLSSERLSDLPAMRDWLVHARATQRIVTENYGHLTEPAARLATCVEENVLVQLEHLRTHPSVVTALARQELNLHAWVYKFETGDVFSYHPEQQQFSEVDAAIAPPTGTDSPAN